MPVVVGATETGGYMSFYFGQVPSRGSQLVGEFFCLLWEHNLRKVEVYDGMIKSKTRYKLSGPLLAVVDIYTDYLAEIWRQIWITLGPPLEL